MNLVDFKKIISYFNPHSVDGFEVNARRDWKILLISFLFVLAAFLLIDGYFFWKFSGALEEEITIEDKKAVTIDKTSLNEALEKIAEREKKFEEGFEAIKVTDPSL